MWGLAACGLAWGAPTRAVEPRRATGYEGPSAPVLEAAAAQRGLALAVTGPDGPGPALDAHPDALLRLVLGLVATAPEEGTIAQDLYSEGHVVRVEVGEGRVAVHHFAPAALVPFPPAAAPADAALRGFSPEEEALVAFGLGALSAQERAMLGPTGHRRVHRFRSASGAGAAADVLAKAPHGRIAWYDGGTTWDEQGFAPSVVGPPDAPRPATARVAIHEIGHLVAASPLLGALRGLRAAADPADAKSWEACVEALAAEGLGMYVPAGYGDVPGARRVTDYAAASDAEAFADGFALWKLDPAALAADWPEVFAWFEAGNHLWTDPCARRRPSGAP